SRSPVVCPDAGFPEPRADDVAIRVRGATLFERADLGRHRRAPLLAGVLDPGGEDRALRAAPAVPRPRRGEPEPALATLDEQRAGTGRIAAVVGDVARPPRPPDDVRGERH